jgi:hypothetical protein
MLHLQHTIHNSVSNKTAHLMSLVERGSAVGKATNYGSDNRENGVLVPMGSRVFTSLYHPSGPEAQPTSYHKDIGV